MAKLDKFHHHEALHMSQFLAECVEKQLVNNRFIKSNKKCRMLVDTACEALNDLYQEIGNSPLIDDRHGKR